MDEIEKIEAFILGWNAHREKVLHLITEESKHWLQNGPSKAAAEAVKKLIQEIPVPKGENEK